MTSGSVKQAKQSSPPRDPAVMPAEGAVARPRLVLACVLCLASAWLAANSIGPLGHPIRFALTWVVLGAATLAAWPGRENPLVRWGAALLGGLALGWATQTMTPAITLLAVGWYVILLAAGRAESDRRLLLSVGCAIVLFAIYRFAAQAISPVWIWSDLLGRALGHTVTPLTKQALFVGATYGGVDFLVLTLAMLAFTCLYLPTGWLGRLVMGISFVAVGHWLYLVALASSKEILEWLPEPAKPELSFAVLPPWSLVEMLRFAVPWHVPVVALVIHLVTAGLLLLAAAKSAAASERMTAGGVTGRLSLGWGSAAVAAVLALILPVMLMWPTGSSSLAGKKVVAYEKGFLNWMKPKHGDYGRFSVGMYGMLPEYLASMGAQCKISSDLSAEDLRGADLIIMFYPNEEWKDGQLERIWDFVRNGGSLLVFGEHTVHEKDGGNRFNDVLAPTGIQVAFDSAEFIIGGWLESYEARFHPTHAGITDDRNQFGVVIGASLELPRWGVRPLLVGRWGWNDPGNLTDPPALMGNRKYDLGEQLGDVVLAAETSLGKGKVIAFGDTSGMTNGIMPGAYIYTSRLMSYLTDPDFRPPGVLRMIVGSLILAALVLILFGRLGVGQLLPIPLLLGLSVCFCLRADLRSIQDLPDGGRQIPNNLAFIDGTHLSAASDESWRDEGTAGLNMTLTRCGYLTLHLTEFTRERLEKAGLLISIAPSKHFTPEEVAILRDFVSNGGILILTVGVEDPRREAALSLAAEFDFFVGDQFPDEQGRVPESEPLGHFKSPYVNVGDYMAHVRFWAAWPVLCRDPQQIYKGSTAQRPHPDARAIAYGRGDRNVILLRRYGKGQIVFVGDTFFATNKNLERIDGSPFEGLRENQDFWRWLLSFLNGQTLYMPPDPRAAQETPAPIAPPPVTPPVPVEAAPAEEVVPAPQEGTP